MLGLTPWMDYEFRVIASNILGTGEPSGPSSRIRTKEAGQSLSVPKRSSLRAQTLALPGGGPSRPPACRAPALLTRLQTVQPADEEGAQVRDGLLRGTVLQALGPTCPKPSLKTRAGLITP